MAIPLRLDFDAPGLRAIAKQTKAAGQARRLLALAAIYDGASRSEAAAIGSVTLQIVRDWVLKFNADGPAGLIDRSPPGQPARLNAAQRAALAQVIEDGPIPAIHGVVRWRLIDLCQWMWEEHRVSICKSTMSQEVRALGYRKLTARPRHHTQAEDAIETFKKPVAGRCPPVAVETVRSTVDVGGGAAEKFLVVATPSKNVAHGLLRA